MSEHVEQTVEPKRRAGVSLHLVLGAVRHHPFLFAGLVFVAATIGAAVWAFMPLPKNTASVVFHISGNAPRVISPTADTQLDLNSYKQRQAALVKRRLVLNEVRKRPEVAQVAALQQAAEPVEWLDRNLLVDARDRSEYLRVYMEGDQPEDMVAILTAVKEAFLQEVDRQEHGTRDQRLRTLDDAIASQRKQMESAQKGIDNIAKSLQYADTSSMLQFQEDLLTDLKAARRAMLTKDYLLQHLKSTAILTGDEPPLPAAAVPAALIDEAVDKEPAMRAAETNVVASRQALAKVEKIFEPGTANAVLNQAKEDVKAAEEERDRLRTELRGRTESAIKRTAAAEAETAKTRRAERLKEVEQEKQLHANEVKDLTTRLNDFSLNAADITRLRKEIASQDKLLVAMTDERERLAVEKQAPRRVDLAEAPYVVAGVEGNRRLRNAGVAGGGVFMLGMLGLVGWEFRRKRVGRPDELASVLGIPLLGTLPPVQSVGEVSKRELVEAIDSARTTLLRRRTGFPPFRTLVVTSGSPGEGKTSLASHLAISLARAGFRTLLVDGDVHRPSLHGVFGLSESPGLCELLREETGTAAAVQTTTIPNLCVMPAGHWSLAARQSLVRDRWLALRGELEDQFDYLVVDTAPLLLMTDTQLLAQAADGVVLSALIGVSNTTQSDLACRRLVSLGVPVLGVVVGGDTTTLARRHRYYFKAQSSDEANAVVPLSPA